jgi:hypothetical protein
MDETNLLLSALGDFLPLLLALMLLVIVSRVVLLLDVLAELQAHLEVLLVDGFSVLVDGFSVLLDGFSVLLVDGFSELCGRFDPQMRRRGLARVLSVLRLVEVICQT